MSTLNTPNEFYYTVCHINMNTVVNEWNLFIQSVDRNATLIEWFTGSFGKLKQTTRGRLINRLKLLLIMKPIPPKEWSCCYSEERLVYLQDSVKKFVDTLEASTELEDAEEFVQILEELKEMWKMSPRV